MGFIHAYNGLFPAFCTVLILKGLKVPSWCDPIS